MRSTAFCWGRSSRFSYLARFIASFTEARSGSPKRASCWPLGSRLLGWLWRRWGGLQLLLHCWTNSALLFLFGMIWAVWNWLLSTAAVFVATEQKGSLSAIASCARLCMEHTGRVLATGVWFGLAHLGAFIVAVMAGFTILSTVGAWRMGPALVLEFLIVGGYCAVADFLYTGRLAAYVAIVRGPEAELSGETSPLTPS